MLAKFHLQPSDVPGSSGSVASIPSSDRIAPWVIRSLALYGWVILSGKLASEVIPNEWPIIYLIDCFYLNSENLLFIVKTPNKWSTPLSTLGVERAVLHHAFTVSYATGSQTSSTLEQDRNTNSQALPETYWMRNSRDGTQKCDVPSPSGDSDAD